MSDQPRIGRPPMTKPRAEEKSMLSVLVPPALKSRIIAASEASGRSLSAESEVRLEISFLAQDMFTQGSQLFWDGNSGFVFLIGELFNKFTPKGDWSTDEWSQITIERAIRRTFVCLFDVETALRRFEPDLKPRDRDRVDTGSPEDRADFFLHQLGDPASDWAAAKRERFGELLAERLTAWHERVEATPYVQARRAGEAKPAVISVDHQDMWDRAFGQDHIVQGQAAARARSADEAATVNSRRGRQRRVRQDNG